MPLESVLLLSQSNQVNMLPIFLVLLISVGGLAQVCNDTLTDREMCCNPRNAETGTLEIKTIGSNHTLLNSTSIDVHHRGKVDANVTQDDISNVVLIILCELSVTYGPVCFTFFSNVTVTGDDGVVKVECVFDPSGGSHCDTDIRHCLTPGTLRFRSVLREELIPPTSKHNQTDVTTIEEMEEVQPTGEASDKEQTYPHLNNGTMLGPGPTTNEGDQHTDRGTSGYGVVGGLIIFILTMLVILKIGSMILKRRDQVAIARYLKSILSNLPRELARENFTEEEKDRDHSSSVEQGESEVITLEVTAYEAASRMPPSPITKTLDPDPPLSCLGKQSDCFPSPLVHHTMSPEETGEEKENHYATISDMTSWKA